jgi:hypothetical protein
MCHIGKLPPSLGAVTLVVALASIAAVAAIAAAAAVRVPAAVPIRVRSRRGSTVVRTR